MTKTIDTAKDAAADTARAFEAFKHANDTRDALEAKGRADVLVDEKVARIDAALHNLQLRMDREAALAARAPRSFETRAASRISQFLRTGDAPGFEAKALTGATSAAGGAFEVPEIEALLDRRLGELSPLRAVASVRQTGAVAYKKPVSDAAISVGWAAETDARPQTNTATISLLDFPTGELYAMPSATQQLLDDAFVNLEDWLVSEIDAAFAAQETVAFVTGDGVAKPKGLLAQTVVADASRTGKQLGYIATGAAGAFAASNPSDALLDLIYAPKAEYRGNARFAMNRKTLSVVRKFKDSTGNYLWQPALTIGASSSLAGYPVLELEAMPDVAANSYSVAFGDFARGYLIVDRAGVSVLRDPYSAKPYVLFYVTKRVGGNVQDFEAIKLLKFAAS